MEHSVGIYKQNNLYYSEKPPYLPPSIYEEYPFKEDRGVDKDNEVYASLRQVLKLLGLDIERFGTRGWNPFGSFIFPGHTVLLKPNLVKHFSERGGVSGLITHGSLIRAVVDYVYIALKGKGRIVIADGPMDDGDFEGIAGLTGLYEIRRFYKEKVDFNIEIYDLRQERVIKKNEKIVQRIKLEGDPAGYTSVDLGKMSEFKKGSLDYRSFRGAECKTDVMSAHHNEDKNEYLISNTFLNSDVVINLPKMKTHKRSGVTLALKNMVGITGDRNWLPHSSETPCCGKKKDSKKSLTGIFGLIKKVIGLARPLRDILRQFVGVSEATIQAGNWYGNDIIWRTIIDLAHITSYADKDGVMQTDKQRKIFAIVDGIVAGEGDGPLNPSPKKCGVLIAGFNGFCVDAATSRVMGFDPMKIPKFKNISDENYLRLCGLDITDIQCVSNVEDWDKRFFDIKGRCMGFKPHYGWKGHIEVDL